MRVLQPIKFGQPQELATPMEKKNYALRNKGNYNKGIITYSNL